MDKAVPKSSHSKLPLKEETLQHLKVRTNLKGGVAAFGFICGRQGSELQLGAAVINPVAR